MRRTAPPIAYALATAASGAALALGLILRAHVDVVAPLFALYAAVAITSWYGGFGPGVLATAISAAAGVWVLGGAVWAADASGHASPWRVLLFVLAGALIAWLNGQLHDARLNLAAEARAARAGEAKARRLAESNMIGVFFADLDGRVRWGNAEFLKLVGHTNQELADHNINWRDLTAPEHRPRDERAIAELQACRICTPFEKEHLLRDGRRVPVLMGCAMLDDSDAECVAFLVDLTERRRAEAELRSHERRLHELASQLFRAEESERRRIATVLHDSVSATLALVKRKLDNLRQQQPSIAPPDQVDSILALLGDAISRTRSLTSELSPPVLYELGLVPALQWLGDLFTDHHGLCCGFQDDGLPKPLSDELRLVLFHAVRELLMNAVKHAKPHTCRITISRVDQHVRITVEDDGKGFSRPPSEKPVLGDGGFGLFNIRERLSHLGGQLEIRSRLGHGTIATLTAPLTSDT